VENGMTGIGGPGGIGGPKGPQGPSGPEDVSRPGDVSDVADPGQVGQASGTGRAADIDALSAEVAAGRLTSKEAIDRLVDATATPDMDATERAELREMLSDLVANDPYLGALANRV
jgi:hypothetical protein